MNEIIDKINTVVDDVIKFFIHNFEIVFVYLIYLLDVVEVVVVGSFVDIFIRLNQIADVLIVDSMNFMVGMLNFYNYLIHPDYS